jgi:hypothetical protein
MPADAERVMVAVQNLGRFHNCRQFEFRRSLVCRSRHALKQFYVERGGVQKSLNRFEKLIREAIALLIERGEIKIPQEKRRSSRPTGKKEQTETGKANDGIVTLLEDSQWTSDNNG